MGEFKEIPRKCQTCKHWSGKRTRDNAWCYRLNIPTIGSRVCSLYDRRENARCIVRKDELWDTKL